MKRHYRAVLAGIMITATANAAAPRLGPSSLRAEIAHRGAKAVVDQLYASHVYEDVLMKRIRAGAVDWILLAPVLSNGTDAAASEELGEALVYALPKAPHAVLSVIDLTGKSPPRGVDTVCSASFYEGDPTNPAHYRMAARRALRKVNDTSLRTVKGRCLDQLKRSS